MLKRIDLVEIVVNDIEEANAAFGLLGLPMSRIVTVPDTGTRRVAVRCGAQVLELVQVGTNRDSYSYPERVCADMLAARGEGYAGFSVASSDLAGDVARLRAGGSEIGLPIHAGVVEIAHFPLDVVVLPYVVQEYSLPERTDYDLPVTGIDALLVAIPNTREGRDLYRTQLGLEAHDKTRIPLPDGGTISLYESSNASGLHRVRLRTRDFAAAEEYVMKHGLRYERRGMGSSHELWLDRGLTHNAQITLI